MRLILGLAMGVVVAVIVIDRMLKADHEEEMLRRHYETPGGSCSGYRTDVPRDPCG